MQVTVLFAILSFITATQSRPTEILQPSPVKPETAVSSINAQAAIAHEQKEALDTLEEQMADAYDGFSGDLNTFPDTPTVDLHIPTLNLSQVLQAAVSDNEPHIDPNVHRQYTGLFDRMCDAAVGRFWKFGKCIEKTDTFSALNSTFWYQAAKQELCGYTAEITPSENDPYWDNVTLPNWNISLPSIDTSVSNAYWNWTIPLLAKIFPSQVFPWNKKIALRLDPETLINMDGELQAQYIYSLRQKYNATALDNTDEEFLTKLTVEDDVNSVDKREAMEMLASLVKTAALTKTTCLKLCNQLSTASNKVDPCWEITGLTVLYGVCSAGCLYYA